MTEAISNPTRSASYLAAGVWGEKKGTGFSGKTVTVRNGKFAYRTHRLTGWLNGERIRWNYKCREEADGEKNRLVEL